MFSDITVNHFSNLSHYFGHSIVILIIPIIISVLLVIFQSFFSFQDQLKPITIK